MALDDGKLTGVTSSITLAECLVHPIRLGLSQLQRDYEELITHGAGIDFSGSVKTLLVKPPSCAHATRLVLWMQFKLRSL